MPLLHLLACVAVVAVMVRAVVLTRRVAAGRQAEPRAAQVGLIVVGGLAGWQAGLWLSDSHSDATLMFRAGVIVQFVCAALIAGLTLTQLVIAQARLWRLRAR